ncbi:MAG: glycosyltransferase family 39 protein, partial [Natronomonas sp.]
MIRPLRSLRRRFRETPTETLLAAAVAVLAGVVVFAAAETLFPYHSSNHDEGVYLQQASMLLAGQLELYAGGLADAFHPWFFIEDGDRLYPKYTPVPAAMYAISMALFGEPRVTLAVVAAANAALVYRLGSLAFDRRVGVVASVVYAVSPMALLTTSVFLPYAPTTMLNLAFAVLYLRAVRENSLRSAGLAGAVVGIAFFARPYTAVLFAAPFIAHAAWTVLRGVRADGVWPLPGAARRNALTAALGLLGVGIALAYNARVTGSPL